jgi:hypothetical protein
MKVRILFLFHFAALLLLWSINTEYSQHAILPETVSAGSNTAVSPNLTHTVATSPMATTTAHNIHLVGHFQIPASAIAIQGSYAYVGSNNRLLVLDISNEAQPVLVGQTVDLPDTIDNIVLVGNYAYLANATGGLRIIDIADPTAPVAVGHYTHPWLRATEVVVKNELAYVTGWSGVTFSVINVANPTAPYWVGGYNRADARGLEVSGNYAYVAGGIGVSNAWLDIIDISNPANPITSGTYSSPGRPGTLTIVDNYAYVAESMICGGGFCDPNGGGLRILNVTNPIFPYQMSHYNQTFHTALDIIVNGNYAYVAAWFDGLRVLDVGNPWVMQEIGYYKGCGSRAIDLALSDNLVYVANGPNGLSVLYVAQNLALTSNYGDGAPGSFFLLSGTGFLPSQTAEITVNGRSLGTTLTDENGSVNVALDTEQANAGTYIVTVTTGPVSRAVHLILDPALPVRSDENSDIILIVPAGIAYTTFNYLPLVGSHGANC